MRTHSLAAVPFFFVLCGALAACGSSTSNGNSGGSPVTGTVNGIGLTVASEVASLPSESCTVESDGGVDHCGSITGKSVTVLLSNRASTTCANEFASYANLAALNLVMNNEAGVVAGTYSIADGVAGSTTMAAGANFSTTTSTCTSELQGLGSTGTITLTEFTSARVAGSYDITFGTNGALSGSFDVAICEVPNASGVDAGPVICQP